MVPARYFSFDPTGIHGPDGQREEEVVEEGGVCTVEEDIELKPRDKD